jgi:hypothetical protein
MIIDTDSRWLVLFGMMVQPVRVFDDGMDDTVPSSLWHDAGNGVVLSESHGGHYRGAFKGFKTLFGNA